MVRSRLKQLILNYLLTASFRGSQRQRRKAKRSLGWMASLLESILRDMKSYSLYPYSINHGEYLSLRMFPSKKLDSGFSASRRRTQQAMVPYLLFYIQRSIAFSVPVSLCIYTHLCSDAPNLVIRLVHHILDFSRSFSSLTRCTHNRLLESGPNIGLDRTSIDVV